MKLNKQMIMEIVASFAASYSIPEDDLIVVGDAAKVLMNIESLHEGDLIVFLDKESFKLYLSGTLPSHFHDQYGWAVEFIHPTQVKIQIVVTQTSHRHLAVKVEGGSE
jgi:hypothetical protein